MLLPLFGSADLLWYAMPITELVVMIYAASAIKKYSKAH